VYYNQATFEYYKNLSRVPFRLATIVSMYSDPTTININEVLSPADYIVAKTGDQGPNATNYRNWEVSDELAKESSEFSLLNEYELPDGSRALVYKHK